MRWMGMMMVLWLSGCSLVWVDRPPETPGWLLEIDRAGGVDPRFGDTVFAGLAVSGFARELDDTAFGRRREALALYTALAAAYGASAYYGYKTSAACRAAKARTIARSAGP